MPKYSDVVWTALRWSYAFWFFSGSFVVMLHQFTGQPEFPRVEPSAQAFLDALHASQFLYPLLALSYLVGGVALFKRMTAPLGLVILAAPTAVIVAFHVFLSGKPLWGALVGGIFALLAWRERERFAGLWRETRRPEAFDAPSNEAESRM
jgi:hypothetical protein